MNRIVTLALITGVAVTAAACTDSKRARNAATWGDKPADITCWSYGTEVFSGRSTGKVEHNDGGRIAFVDAANDRYTTVDGECRVVYLKSGDEAEPEQAAAESETELSADTFPPAARPQKIPAQ